MKCTCQDWSTLYCLWRGWSSVQESSNTHSKLKLMTKIFWEEDMFRWHGDQDQDKFWENPTTLFLATSCIFMFQRYHVSTITNTVENMCAMPNILILNVRIIFDLKPSQHYSHWNTEWSISTNLNKYMFQVVGRAGDRGEQEHGNFWFQKKIIFW